MSKRPRHAYAAQAWAQEQRVGQVGLKATLLLLAAYADEEASCYPSQARIAEETEQDQRTVRRHMEILREVGLIVSERRVAGGRRTSDRHWLQLDVTVGVAEVEEARARVEARAAARRAAKATSAAPQEDTVSGSQEDTVSGGSPDTGRTSYRTPDALPTGHLVSYEGDVLPSGVTSPQGTARERTAASCPAAPGGASEQASSTTPDETPADVAALRRAITAGGHGVVSWRGLNPAELTELAGLVAVHGVTAMAARADHQARQRGGPPGHVRAWLPEWRDLVPPALAHVEPAGLRRVAADEVPEPERHRLSRGELRAAYAASKARGGAA